MSAAPVHPIAPVVPLAPRRGRRALLVVAAAVLVAALAAIPILIVRGGTRDASDPGIAAGGAASSAPSSQTPSPRAASAPPPDWQLYTEPDGFFVGIPKGWQRTVSDDTVVWKDPASLREVRVRTIINPRKDPSDYWLDNRFTVEGIDGYDFSRITSVVYRGWPSADFYYRTGVDAKRAQVVSRLVVPSGPRAYIVTFTTADASWPADKRYFDTATATFGLRQ